MTLHSGRRRPPAGQTGRQLDSCDVAMTVDYQLEPAELAALSEENRRFEPQSLSRLYYFGILPVLGVGLAVAVQSFTIAAGFTILFIATGWFIQGRFRQAYRRNVYSNENLSFSARRWTCTLDADGVRFSSDAAEVLYRWGYIRQVFRGTRYVYFELTPLQRAHVPLRAFRDEQHIQEFLSKAQSCVKPRTS